MLADVSQTAAEPVNAAPIAHPSTVDRIPPTQEVSQFYSMPYMASC